MSWKNFLVKYPVAGASDGTYSAMGGGITGKTDLMFQLFIHSSDVYSGAPKQNRKIWTIQCNGYGQ